MTKWDDICRVASAFGATELSATAWMFEMHGSATAMQKVFVSYEVMEPDLEFIQLRSPIAGIDGADCDAILGEYGQLLVGSMGYVPTWKEVGTEVDGWLALISTIPLALLDLSDEANFLIYCNLIARAAEEIGQSTQAGGIAETADKDGKASTGGASRAFSSAVSHLDAESMKKGAARALGALEGTGIAKIDRKTGRVKVRKLGVVKAAIRPAKTLHKAIDGARPTW